MKSLAVIALALLLMMSVTEQQVQQTGVEDISYDFENQACKLELRSTLTTASKRITTLKTKRTQITELRVQLNTAIAEEKILVNEVQNLTIHIQRLEDTCTTFLPLDCCQRMIASNSSAKTGLYEIKDPCSGDRAFSYAKIHVRCDMETDGGGWIVIQRRIANGTVNFYRNWEDYVNGFGDLDGEFWLGLKNMYELTKQPVELIVTLWNDDDDTITWNYPTFSVGSPGGNYPLTVSGGTGNGGTDGLAYSNRRQFSTFNRDLDGYSRRNCATYHQGGWWHYSSTCTRANLNGRHESSSSWERLFWGAPGNTFTNSEMKIRSKTCGLGS